MTHLLTERQHELAELAGRLADQFAKRAADSALGVETGHDSRAKP